uniref:transposase n=1 Tax=Agathobacter sp. TaxID=2021311 RepID=UPI0040566F69
MEKNKKKKKGAAPPQYDEAFKSGAVRLVTEQGRPSREVARELGICVDTLRSWLKAAGVQPGQTDRQNREAEGRQIHLPCQLHISSDLVIFSNSGYLI